MDWDLYYFVITDFEKLESQDLGAHENIKVGWYSFGEVVDLCLSDKFNEVRSAGVILRFMRSKGVI